MSTRFAFSLSMLSLTALLVTLNLNTISTLALDFDFSDLRFDSAEIVEELTAHA